MNELRWKQRFDNFEKAWRLLHAALDGRPLDSLSDLEKEGVIQRFEYTFELAWKTLKDYLDYSGVALDQLTPRAVIKAAFAARLLADGQAWIDMLEQRNLMAHTYDRANFETAISGIAGRYLGALDQLFALLQREAQQP
jgi:nucleotidyltransferase substrate binding protein (TIGR01987 family)